MGILFFAKIIKTWNGFQTCRWKSRNLLRHTSPPPQVRSCRPQFGLTDQSCHIWTISFFFFFFFLENNKSSHKNQKCNNSEWVSVKNKTGWLVSRRFGRSVAAAECKSLSGCTRYRAVRSSASEKTKVMSWDTFPHARFTMSHTTQTQPLTLTPQFLMSNWCRKLDFKTYQGLHTNTGGAWRVMMGEWETSPAPLIQWKQQKK